MAGIPLEIQNLLRPEHLKPSYLVREADQVLRDGLQADNLTAHVEFGCAGFYSITFTQQGQVYLVMGHCDACDSPGCCDEEGSSITNPEKTLRDWLSNALVFQGRDLIEAKQQVRVSTNKVLTLYLNNLERQQLL
jgi:hypothetical protein